MDKVLLWYCGLIREASIYDKSAGKTYCKTPRHYIGVRHLRRHHGCGWVELTPTEGRKE